jgi:hypothetical protein
MDRPLVVPRIVFVGLMVMVFGAVLAAWAYYYETQVLANGGDLPLFNLFADAFKVGLGAFIGVLSQWASRVFGEGEKGTRPESAAKPQANGGSAKAASSGSQDGAPVATTAQIPGDRPGDLHE